MATPANNNADQKKSETVSGKKDQKVPAQKQSASVLEQDKKPAQKRNKKKASPSKKGTKRQATVKETSKSKTAKIVNTKKKSTKKKNTDRRPVTPPTTNPLTEDIMTTAKTQMEKMMQDAGSVNKEGWDSFMKAGNRFMKGMEEIMQLSMNQAQKTAEKNSQTMKKLMACKTVNEFTEAQTKAAQDNFDEFMKSMTKLSELSVKVTSDCLEPVNDQFSKTVKKANENMAA